MTWTYRYEIKGIQSWILATDRLKEMRGASAVIDGLLEQAKGRMRGAEGIYGAAGAGNAQFARLEDLLAFASRWPAFIEEHAPGSTVVQAWVEGSDIKALQKKLAEARQRPSPSLPEAGPLLRRAGRTGMPAVQDGHHGYEDAATRTKGRHQSKRDRFEDGVWIFTDDFDNADRGYHNEDRYVAVIHADGNQVGQRVEAAQAHGAGAMKAFSEALDKATEAAATHAVGLLFAAETALLRDGAGQVARARPIVCGGDDLTFIVTAQHAIPFAHAFLRAFKAQCEAVTALEGIEASAGIAFVKKHHPFHAAYDVSEKLTKAAKKSLNRQSGLAFHRVTSSAGDESFDTAPAYRLDELNRLAALVQASRKLPRGGLRTWLDLRERSPERAALHWERMAIVAGKDLWAGFIAKLDPLVPADDPEGSIRAACLSDALEWSGLQRPTLNQRSANLLWER